MDSNPEDRWIANRLAALEPTWTPNVTRARALLMTGGSRPRRPRVWWALAAATAVVVAALAPQGRPLAQELWYRLLVSRVEVVRLDLSQVPFDTGITMDGQQTSVESPQEAAALAGFTPYLPPPDVLPDLPAVSVTGPMHLRQTIRVQRLREALARVGADDVEVPDAWEGITLRAVIGPIVVAHYPGEIEILQTVPIQLEIPAGFPLARFSAAAFRTAGLSWWEARALGEEFAARPAWLLDVPADDAALVQRVQLASGDGLLVEDLDDTGSRQSVRATIILSRPTRIYTVSSPTREVSLQVAAALP